MEDETTLARFLNKMGKKGFVPILKYIGSEGDVNYNIILKQAMNNGIVKSHSQVTAILSTLTEFGLLERTVKEKPLRVTYRISKKGRSILQHLQEIASDLE